jgi:hypothetical protein
MLSTLWIHTGLWVALVVGGDCRKNAPTTGILYHQGSKVACSLVSSHTSICICSCSYCHKTAGRNQLSPYGNLLVARTINSISPSASILTVWSRSSSALVCRTIKGRNSSIRVSNNFLIVPPSPSTTNVGILDISASLAVSIIFLPSSNTSCSYFYKTHLLDISLLRYL